MRRRFHSRHSGGSYVSVIFDKSISDPANITIEDDESVLDSILSQFRRCLCKKTADGEVAICYLDDENSYFYEDQSFAELNGEEGDTMVNFPEFWYKWVKIDDNRFAYRFALSNIEGDYNRVDRSLLGAYKSYLDSGKLYSRSGVIPSTNMTMEEYIYYAKKRGTGYRIIDFQQHSIIAFMLYSKYRTRGVQNILGQGGGNSQTQTGDSNMTGIRDTKNETSRYVCGLGIEGVFGGICEFTQDVIINKNIWKISNPDGSIREVQGINKSGWITNIAAENGPFFDIIPISVGGNIAINYCNPYYQSSSDECVLQRSGSGRYDTNVAYTDVSNNAYNSGSSTGSRLSFRGTIHEIQNSSEFKSLPLL